ncbi:PIG-L family deacetylase [Candidatus Gottesmanbacteria bacterium]|nr:PIG-L family deacetylase [Candidatus Gottesmanbacteria bacterium]
MSPAFAGFFCGKNMMESERVSIEYTHTLDLLEIPDASVDPVKGTTGLVMFFFPHQDDDTAFGDKLRRKFQEKGYDVVFVYLTEGEKGKLNGETEPEEIVREVRQGEANHAMRYYKTSQFTLDLGDGVLYRRKENVIDKVSTLLEAANPDYVVTIHRNEITPEWDNTDHPGGDIVISAEQVNTKNLPPGHPAIKRRPHLIEITSDPLKASHYLSVTPQEMDERVENARINYPTQLGFMPPDELRQKYENILQPPNRRGPAREYYFVTR